MAGLGTAKQVWIGLDGTASLGVLRFGKAKQVWSGEVRNDMVGSGQVRQIKF